MASFTARGTTHMDRAVCAVARCLSVRLSVARVYCFKTTKLIIKQLALNCSHADC